MRCPWCRWYDYEPAKDLQTVTMHCVILHLHRNRCFCGYREKTTEGILRHIEQHGGLYAHLLESEDYLADHPYVLLRMIGVQT